MSDYYVALGKNLKIVASDPSRARAKDKAIAAGESTPLVVPRFSIKDEAILAEWDARCEAAHVETCSECGASPVTLPACSRCGLMEELSDQLVSVRYVKSADGEYVYANEYVHIEVLGLRVATCTGAVNAMDWAKTRSAEIRAKVSERLKAAGWHWFDSSIAR